MGHYDSCYESDNKEAYAKERHKRQHSIINTLDDLTNKDLKLLENFAINIKEYKTFFKILKKHTK